jgi:hypothetical protein
MLVQGLVQCIAAQWSCANRMEKQASLVLLHLSFYYYICVTMYTILDAPPTPTLESTEIKDKLSVSLFSSLLGIASLSCMHRPTPA